MIERAVEIKDNVIIIYAQFFVHKDYSITNKEILLDIFSNHYTDQEIVVEAPDGENLKFSGFEEYIKFVADCFFIPYEKITLSTHDQQNSYFNHQRKNLGIFISVKNHIRTFNKNLDNAKFVGAALGRSNPTRLRLVYELDQAFTDDNYLIFQPNLADLKFHLRHFAHLYQKEFAWLSQRKFNQDLASTHHNGNIRWQDSCASYHNIWNNFLIEVVSETDAMSDYWLTEKTARCISTGKPFVLVAGSGSLEKIKSMGFKTFDSVIDESYDKETVPTHRISKIIKSLEELYNSPDKQEKIKSMYNIAEENMSLYSKYVQNQMREQ